MCRSIVNLRGAEAATPGEIEAAALQFVRKVSGTRAPAAANREAFELATAEIAAATGRLRDSWVTPPGARPPALQGSRARAAAIRAQG